MNKRIMFKNLLKKKKNLVFINLDQFRADFVKENKRVFDIVKQGAYFSNVITYAPYTVGAIHSVMSGMYGRYNGVNSYYGSARFREEEVATIAEYFESNGYETYGSTYSNICLPKKGVKHFLTFDGEKDNHAEVHTNIIRGMDAKKPFFLYLHYGYIHTRLMKHVLKKYDDFSKEFFNNPEKNREMYMKSIDFTADYMEAIISALKEIGVYDDTVIYFFTDHGSSLGEVVGEKAYGVFLYQYTIRTWCSILNAGLPPKEFTPQVRGIDYLPTVIDLFSFKEISSKRNIVGKSLLPIIQGKDSEDRIAFSETSPLGGSHPSPDVPSVKSVCDGTWKYIYNTLTDEGELYNIKHDPKETHNLVNKEFEVLSRLRQLLEGELFYE